MPQPSIVYFGSEDVENIPMLSDSQTFTGTNSFSGITTLNGTKLHVRTVTDSTTIAVTDDILNCNKATAMTVNLPAASGSGRVLMIKNINTGVVTVDGDSGDTIDGETTQTLSQWESINVIDYAANAWIIT